MSSYSTYDAVTMSEREKRHDSISIDKKLDTHRKYAKLQGASTWLHVLVVIPRLRYVLR
jgi:hypothetical protein